MTRTHASALLLVNWRGVFYERYELDRHVTALEGANGAGKTTVMIAAYVALFPDLARLRFVNLGETGATGGDRGIYGRLGLPGPAYCGLELSLGGGQRALAGVYLERKAEPSVTLKPFLVEELPSDPPEPLLLERGSEQDSVPPFAELQGRAERLGGRFRAFNGAKEYFSALFELGVTPLRLSTDEERNKLGEMLRTSMTGGISRTLTSDLRSFLFKEQSGLMDTLSRMRKNLEACRRTRVEVSEARGLEGELHSVYERGQAMFQQALGAAARGYDAARDAQQNAQNLGVAASTAVQESTARVEQLQQQSQSAAEGLQHTRTAAQHTRARIATIEQALALLQSLERLEEQWQKGGQRVAGAERAHEAAVSQRQDARLAREAARNELQRAAAGLASLESGLEELHRRSHAYRHALRNQASLEAALGEGSASAQRLPDTVQSIQTKLTALDETWASRDRAARLQERYQASREASREAIRQANRVGRDLASGATHALWATNAADQSLAEAARQALDCLHHWELSALQAPSLQQQLDRVRAAREREKRLRSRLATMGLERVLGSEQLLEHIANLERALQEARAASGQHQAQRQEAEAASKRALQRQAELQSQAEACRRMRSLEARLQLAPDEAIGTEAQLQQTLETCYAEQANQRAQLEQTRQQARALETELAEAGQSGHVPELELAELAEALGGQVLSERYESLDFEAARRVQAQLGPLMDAIVVSDPKAAAVTAQGIATTRDSLWLLDRAAPLPLEEADRTWVEGAKPAASSATQQVLVPFEHGVRLARLPADPRLGHRARTARRKRLEQRLTALQKGEQEQELRAQAARERIEILRKLQPLRGTPPLANLETSLQECEAELSTQRARLRHAQDCSCTAELEATRIQASLAALRLLLPQAHLLDENPQSLDPEILENQLRQARSAALAVEALAQARATLTRELPTLEDPSFSERTPEHETWQQEQKELLAERKHWFQLSQAANELKLSSEALAWVDAPAALEQQRAVVPELGAQHARAQQSLENKEEACERWDASWEAASEARQSERAKLAGLETERARIRTQLAELDPAGSLNQAALDDARTANESELREATELEREERALSAQLALARHEAATAQARAAQALEAAETAKRTLGPIEQEVARLHQRVEELGLELPSPDAPQRGPAELWALTASAFRRLLDQLQRTSGAGPLAEQLSQRLSPAQKEQDALAYIEAWQAVRAWLLQRLPKPLAALDDPLQGLVRLRTDLEKLEQRLSHQEQELKGASSDVARTIDVQIRRAGTRVRRLNQHLVGLSFGSVQAIRVNLSRAQRMQQVLAALRECETQELLFQTQLPIEEAFGEIFRRYGGGRGGGRRLIDFREYLELEVEIQRRGSDDWQRVNPSRVSTGEAIGVGAALMMVTLAEWEREGSLLRGKREMGSLRFLFLDEANRLSQDNLAALFELCRSLDLQLLIAAPEVAKAHGNTTYRLVRRLREDGEEEVVVSGRRARSEPLAAPSSPTQLVLGAGP